MISKNYKTNNKVKVTDLETGETTSLKKHRKETDRKYLLVSHIIDKKVLSKTELEKLVASGVLKEVRHKNKRCIDKATLVDYLGNPTKD